MTGITINTNQCQKNAENGKYGGRPKKQKTHWVLRNKKPRKRKDKGKDKEKGEGEGIYERLRALYNETCVSFPRCIRFRTSGRKALHARLQQYSLEDFKTLFSRQKPVAFSKGGNRRNWTATFDWLIADANMAKVLDGNYDDQETTGGDWGLDFDRQDF